MFMAHTIADAIGRRNSIRQFTACYHRSTIQRMGKEEIRIARLRELVDQDGGPAAFAKRSRENADKPIDASYVSQILNGHRAFGEKAALSMATRAGLEADFFDQADASDEEGFSVIKPPTRGEDIDAFTIPSLSAVGSMGHGADLVEEDDVIDKMTLKGDWLRKNVSGSRINDLAIISGKGNLMSPTFSNGDLLLVDTGARSVDIDGVYVLSAHGRLFVKTVRQRIDGSYEVSSDNQSVKTVDVLKGDNEVFVHGRVVWAWNGKRL